MKSFIFARNPVGSHPGPRLFRNSPRSSSKRGKLDSLCQFRGCQKLFLTIPLSNTLIFLARLNFPISPQYENYYQPRRWIVKITFEKWIMLRVFECFLVSGECHAFPRGPSDSWGTPHGKNALPAVQSEIHCETIIWSIFTFSPIFSPNQLTFISRLLIFSKISCKNITPITWIARLKKRLSAS